VRWVLHSSGATDPSGICIEIHPAESQTLGEYLINSDRSFMLQDYLIPIEEAAVVFLWMGILLLIPVCVVHYWRFGYVMPSRAGVFYSFLFYALCAICLVIWPPQTMTPDFCEVHTLAYQLRLVPLRFVADIVQVNQVTVRHVNLISILESSVFLQTFFNFLLLMPLGFYLRYYFRVRWRLTFAIALATTATIELSQITGLFEMYPCPYRTFDVDDLILNTAGAMVGYQAMPLFHRYLPDLTQRHARPTSVSVYRRWVAFAMDWFMANSVSRLLSTLLFSDSPAHPLWLDLVVYTLWFVGVPWCWQGQTVGKALVNIRLVNRRGNAVSARQLYLRYGLLIALPILTETTLINWVNLQLASQGYRVSWFTHVLLGLLLLELIGLVGLMVIRHDHLGFHDLTAKTKHRII
jgi:glycopeptide antibiotics resistance protein